LTIGKFLEKIAGKQPEAGVLAMMSSALDYFISETTLRVWNRKLLVRVAGYFNGQFVCVGKK